MNDLYWTYFGRGFDSRRLHQFDMKEEDRASLNDTDMLFTLLTAIVKKSGREIRITEEEMDAVKKSDMMLMYYDKTNKEIILSLQLLKGPADEEVF